MTQFHVGDTNMAISQNAKICVSPNAKPTICITPNKTPNASQWIYIGCVGSPGVGAHVEHVHFRLFVSISFALGSQRKCGFSVEYGLKIMMIIHRTIHISQMCPVLDSIDQPRGG